MPKVKFNLEVVSVKKDTRLDTGKRFLDVEFNILQGKKVADNFHLAFPLGTDEKEIKKSLTKYLYTYTLEHQPLSEEEKERRKLEKESDIIVNKMEGYKL